MEKLKTVLEAVLTILKANVKKVNFWVSLGTLGIVGWLVYLKLVLKVDVTSSSVLGVITLIGILVSLFGQMLGNKEVEDAGENIDSTKIAKTADTIADTITALQKQVKSITETQTAIAMAVNADTTTATEDTVEEAKTTTTSIGSVLDADGNIVGTASTT
ncbi:hypothetical protein, partial [Liquorilactobacillus mali]